MTVADASAHFARSSFRAGAEQICEGAMREIESRLRFLLDVGLDYLTLDRAGPSLSGGEAQRIRLASQLGSELSGVMYVLDEPSIGLHPRDNARLIATLRRLRDLGNSVIVVEHDEETIRAADHVVDFGPGAGHLGGTRHLQRHARGRSQQATASPGLYLSRHAADRGPRDASHAARHGSTITRRARAQPPRDRREDPARRLHRRDRRERRGQELARQRHPLARARPRSSTTATGRVGAHGAIDGLAALDKVIAIDQQPIGRTPRSNPGTYTKAFDAIRDDLRRSSPTRARAAGTPVDSAST